MKRKILPAILCVLVLAAAVPAKIFILGTRPLKSLRAEEVSSAIVELYPPDVTLQLTADEIGQLISILNQVVTYQRDDTYGEYDGQAVIFTLTKIDGTQIRVQAYNPFVVINGVGYRTKYEPCEDLNRLGNKLNSNYR